MSREIFISGTYSAKNHVCNLELRKFKVDMVAFPADSV